MEDFLLVGRWLLNFFSELWSFLGVAGFLGFAVIGFVILKKLIYLFKKIIV